MMKSNKLIIAALALLVTIGTSFAQDNGQSDIRTLRLALSKVRWDDLTVQNKVLDTLCKYQLNVDEPTQADKDKVLLQFNFTDFVATANTSKAVYVYDYSLPKARPNEPDSMSWADLELLRAKVDDDPQITLDIIKASQSKAWFTTNGISRKVIEP